MLKSFSIANHAILLFCILATLVGSLISSDWQAFGHDPCYYRIDNISNTSLNDTVLTNPENYTTLSHTINATLNTLQSVKFDDVLSSVNASYLHADHCVALSTEDHACYWNPVSRITGKLCTGCHPICRSQQRSVNFVQFTTGFCVILFVSQLFLTSVYSVASDYAPKRFQVISIV